MNTEAQMPPVASGTQAEKSRKWRWIKIAIWSLAVIVVAIAVLGFGIYRLGWDSSAVRAVERVLPLPVAIVDWHMVTLNEYHQRLDAYKHAMAQQENFDFADPANAEKVKAQKEDLLQRIIDLRLQKNMASKRNITVTQSDINEEMLRVATQAKAKPEELDKLINDVYGWSKDTFISEVIVPQIRERKLRVAFASDRNENKDAFARIEEAKAKIAGGTDFAAVAKEYSNDAYSKDQGGDLGWVAKGTFVPEFEDAAVKLAPNQVSDITVSQYGLHLIQLLEKKGDNADGEQFHLRHILVVTKDFDEWFKGQHDSAKIWKFNVTL